MKKLAYIIALLSIIACNKDSDKKPNLETTEKKVIEKEFQFPNDYLGIYKGELLNTSSNGTEKIPMELHLLKTQDSMRFDYKIFYGQERSERGYTLVKTENPNIYELDENNGIVLPIAYSKNTLFSTYEVAGNLLNNSEVFYEDRMDFMITMSSLKTKEAAGEAEGYQVTSYPVLVMQQATLYKIKE